MKIIDVITSMLLPIFPEIPGKFPEILHFRNNYNPNSVCVSVHEEYWIGMLALYPNLALAYRLILTLPVSSCSCERSFSAVKFVKNSLRSTMSSDRLSDLS